VRWSNGVATIEIDGVVKSASGKSLTGEEYYPYIGAAMQGGAAVNEFAGIIKGAEIYVSSQKIVELVPQSLTKDAWLDVSGNMMLFGPGSKDASIDIILAEVGSSTGGSEYTDLERVNLFNPEDVMPGHILDVDSGGIGTWDSDARGEYSAVCITPARLNKYYCIINPYSTEDAIRVGVVSRARRDAGLSTWDYGNPNANNIVLTGNKYTIAKAVCTRTDSAADTINSVIDAISYVVYRVQNTVPYPIDTPMIEVYEMNSAEEAISYLNSRFGESKELPADVNIARKLLSSDNVGTLSSMFKDKSMLVLGDSLSANHAWTNYVANQLKWKGINNIAIGGANICGSYNVTSGKQRNLLYQIREAANLLGDVCYAEGELVDGVYTKKMDYVFISMGYNDAHNNWETGSLASVKDVAWSSLAPVNDDAMFSNIAAAVKYCLFLLKTTPIEGSITVNGEVKNVKIDCTHAKIVWQTPIATSNLWYDWTAAEVDARMIEVENVIAEVCNYYSVPVVNGRLLCGITREEENLYEGGKYLSDKTHPNADGYIKLGEMNLKAILGDVGYDSAVNDKQDTLVSGMNIKTINNQSLLGGGNITIQGGGGGGGGQVQADWDETDASNMAYIKNKPTNVSAFNNDAGYLTQHQSIKTVNNTSLVGNGNIDLVPTETFNNFCPIIEDTRSSAVTAITGVAPFNTLVDGQRILLHLNLNAASGNHTLNLTLSDNTTTGAKTIKARYNSSFANVGGGYPCYKNDSLPLVYNSDENAWLMLGVERNNTYSTISQSHINAGTSNSNLLVTPILFHDNAYIVELTYTSGNLKANKLYDFGTVSSLTIPSLDATNDLVSNALNFYALRFIAGADNLNITFPTGVIVDDEPTINTGDYVEIMINLYVENNTNHFYASIKVWQAQ
jgi:lysophospholipase L1-like esterase